MTRNRTFSEIAFPDGGIPKYGTAMMQPQYCGKWAVLELLLKEWRKDQTNKLLIFTKSVKLLEMLDFHLNTKGKFVDNQTTVGKFELLLGQDIPFSNLMATPNNLIVRAFPLISTLHCAVLKYTICPTHLQFACSGMPMIDSFNKDPNVFIFLISTLAGGTGLNLTGKCEAGKESHERISSSQHPNLLQYKNKG